MVEIITNSVDETIDCAGRFGRLLKGGEIIGLSGELGSGKTAFVKGIAFGLGYKGYVKSPTFTIVNQYHTDTLTLFHLDVYRLSSFEELLLIGFESIISEGAVMMIEWFDKFPELSQYQHISINLDYAGESSRKIRFNTNSSKFIQILNQI